ncbi:hypothetical protein B0T17DRAFT_95249 [Bombardia bombarda]|uniref:Uncharacterized protein n=1 Tax=Bombardia bombarda TaxID=252184 RepID=A0AA39XNQ6_9PEZI|nr:hypothetical protein B0T17DRAFT_95249 [Bombardia bombarda]
MPKSSVKISVCLPPEISILSLFWICLRSACLPVHPSTRRHHHPLQKRRPKDKKENITNARKCRLSPPPILLGREIISCDVTYSLKAGSPLDPTQNHSFASLYPSLDKP